MNDRPEMKLIILWFIVTSLFSPVAMAATAPTRVGQCSNSFVQEVSSRFGARVGEFGSENSILILTNSLRVYLYRKLRMLTAPDWGISNESEPISLGQAIGMYRVNDKAKACLEYIPVDCDYRQRLGDRGGEVYYISNYRTNETAFGHYGRNGCGGA
ncbi:MAG: hypothetical protein QE276_08305 [Cyanobium sp. D14.bin.5]|nr:hypothetical protein [Cyanobium sp. D14.bin.5]